MYRYNYCISDSKVVALGSFAGKTVRGIAKCDPADTFNIEDGKEVNYYHRVQRWERIYLEEGEAGFYIERRGRATKMDNPKIGRPRKKQLDKQVEEDLIAENQRLRMENEYLKKLNALVQERIERERKKK